MASLVPGTLEISLKKKFTKLIIIISGYYTLPVVLGCLFFCALSLGIVL